MDLIAGGSSISSTLGMIEYSDALNRSSHRFPVDQVENVFGDILLRIRMQAAADCPGRIRTRHILF